MQLDLSPNQNHLRINLQIIHSAETHLRLETELRIQLQALAAKNEQAIEPKQGLFGYALLVLST